METNPGLHAAKQLDVSGLPPMLVVREPKALLLRG